MSKSQTTAAAVKNKSPPPALQSAKRKSPPAGSTLINKSKSKSPPTQTAVKKSKSPPTAIASNPVLTKSKIPTVRRSPRPPAATAVSVPQQLDEQQQHKVQMSIAMGNHKSCTNFVKRLSPRPDLKASSPIKLTEVKSSARIVHQTAN